jgi:type II secretory pathway pseudopilin PulG
MGGVLKRQSGYTYLLLLALVAVLGSASAMALRIGESMSIRERERELLFIGEQFRLALLAYDAATPAGMPRSPLELIELVDDRRSGTRRVHLRRIYPDPLTGSTVWGLARNTEGRVIGIHSRAPGTPRMRTGFSAEYKAFEDSACYSEWMFRVSVDAFRQDTSVRPSHCADRARE